MYTILSLFPAGPWTLATTLVHVVAVLGAILLVYGIYLEAEKRQDEVFTIGASCLAVYALWLGNVVFSVTMIVFALSAFVEVVTIMLGRHHHTASDVEKYKNPQR